MEFHVSSPEERIKVYDKRRRNFMAKELRINKPKVIRPDKRYKRITKEQLETQVEKELKELDNEM